MKALQNFFWSNLFFHFLKNQQLTETVSELSEFETWMTISTKGSPTLENATQLNEFSKENRFYQPSNVGSEVDRMLSGSKQTSSEETVELVLVDPRNLGYGLDGSGSWMNRLVWAAEMKGLRTLSVQEVASLRVAYKNQPVGETLKIGMTPIVTDLGNGQESVLAISTNEFIGGKISSGIHITSSNVYNGDLIVFAKRS